VAKRRLRPILTKNVYFKTKTMSHWDADKYHCKTSWAEQSHS
jgi:hypothetical protein